MNSITDPGQPWVMTHGVAPRNGRADVQEVDVDPVDRRYELLVAVQPISDAPHLVGLRPVPGELLHVRQWDPHRPVADGLLLRPSRSR